MNYQEIKNCLDSMPQMQFVEVRILNLTKYGYFEDEAVKDIEKDENIWRFVNVITPTNKVSEPLVGEYITSIKPAEKPVFTKH